MVLFSIELSVPQAVGLAALGLGTWMLSTVVYRLYFHKLASFPGPRLAVSTYLYEWYYDLWLGGQYTWKLKELHERYGPVVRVNPDELHFNDPDYYDSIFNNSNGPTEKPYNSANTFGPYPAAIGTIQHDLHRVRRAAINPFFSRRSVASIIKFTKGSVENLCRRLEEASKTGEMLNMKYAYYALTLDIITEYCFSDCGELVLKPDFDKRSLDDIDGLAAFGLLNMHLPWLLTPLFNLEWLLRRVNSAMADVYQWRQRLAGQIDDIQMGRNKRLESSGHETVFHSLLDSNLPDIEKSRDRLRDEAFSLVSAGSGTTAYVLKAITFHVMDNPEVHSKLLADLKTIMPSKDSQAELADFERLPYLTAVIQEGLRLSNAIVHRHLRSFTEKTLIYKQWKIPPGTTVMMTSYLMHHDESIFPDSHTFKPERWLNGGQQKLQRYLTPFSRGTRGCAGVNLAWAELYTVLGTVFRRFEFDISSVDPARDIVIVRDTLIAATARDSPGLLVKVKARSD